MEKYHDLCEIDQYRHPIKETIWISGKESHICDEEAWEYNPNTLVKGHGDKSVILLSQHMTLTKEESMCILYHMGAFADKEHWRSFTDAVRKEERTRNGFRHYVGST